MSLDEARMVVAALAEPEALLVFGAIVTATSRARLLNELGRPMEENSYISPFGLEKKTSLPRDVIERAADRLKRVGLLEVLPDAFGRGFESWRVNQAALVTASR